MRIEALLLSAWNFIIHICIRHEAMHVAHNAYEDNDNVHIIKGVWKSKRL